jgi:hypothetical protein
MQDVQKVGLLGKHMGFDLCFDSKAFRRLPFIVLYTRQLFLHIPLGIVGIGAILGAI